MKQQLERQIDQLRVRIYILERELREINNKLHQGETIVCHKCHDTFNYLADEIVKEDGEPVCWGCFDE